MKAERGEEATGEKYKAKRDYFMRLKERNHLHKIKVHSEEASADVEAAVSYPEGLSWIIEGGSLTHRFPTETNSLLVEEDAI